MRGAAARLCALLVVVALSAATASTAEEPVATPTERTPPSGWRRVVRSDVTLWCSKDKTATGSRISQPELCMTPGEYDSMQQANRDALRDISRKKQPSARR